MFSINNTNEGSESKILLTFSGTTTFKCELYSITRRNLVVLHGILENGGNLFTSGFTSRSELSDTMLRQGTFNQGGNVRRIIAQSAQTVGNTQIFEETSELLSEDLTSHGFLDVGRVSTESGSSINVTIRASGSSETEDGGCSQGNRDTMRLYKSMWVSKRVSLFVFLVEKIRTTIAWSTL